MKFWILSARFLSLTKPVGDTLDITSQNSPLSFKRYPVSPTLSFYWSKVTVQTMMTLVHIFFLPCAPSAIILFAFLFLGCELGVLLGVHIHTHTLSHTHAHTHTHTHTHAHTHTHTHTHIHARTHAHTHTQVFSKHHAEWLGKFQNFAVFDPLNLALAKNPKLGNASCLMSSAAKSSFFDRKDGMSSEDPLPSKKSPMVKSLSAMTESPGSSFSNSPHVRVILHQIRHRPSIPWQFRHIDRHPSGVMSNKAFDILRFLYKFHVHVANSQTGSVGSSIDFSVQ